MKNMRKLGCFGTCTTVLLLCYFLASADSDTVAKEKAKAAKYPPCASCRILVDSFKRGVDRTNRGKFDGGDSAWEEDKLGSYKTSEVRLIEIQEKLCTDVDSGESQCMTLAEEFESAIEEWWFRNQNVQPDLFSFLCIDHAKRCCPPNKFGPDCSECPGYPDKICQNNGKCKGAGTRKGNGKCVCDKGYQGWNCFECADGFYISYQDDKNLLCSQCHSACDGPCKGAGPTECKKCASGWEMKEGKGCEDIDECINSEKNCPVNKFCVNGDGSYACLACDKACNGCTGDGPDMCVECAEGFHKNGNICVDTDILGRKRQENIARYATYIGLCVATFIILQRNTFAAAVVGLLVGVYISVSEYMIATSGIQDTSANVGFVGGHSQ